ncbi:MAG: phosphatidate cytidylyltransferase [Deltaproteobacteria bacterium]|jgi:phosphatidate cytidylyltransferase|nr:phosphatidate cytidylyltransferase [Deltaproteobacteria bacterium]
MQHINRWITALILIPILLWILVKGSTLLLAAVVSIVAIFAMGEYLRIILQNDDRAVSNTIKIISYAASMILIVSACLGSLEIEFLILSLNLMALSIFVLFEFADNKEVFHIIAKQFLGIIYIPVSLSLLLFIKEFDQGNFWIIWLLITVFSNDTGAFYGGKFFGKNALSPNISPNKTIEGSIGGIITSLIVGFIFSVIFFKDFSLSFLMIPASFMLAVAGQIGDLFESAMKRASNIKDSGSILPGHGGMLDRIDGLLFAIPVLYVYLVFILHVNSRL